MAILTFYGSSVAATTPSTACQATQNLGGTETSKTTTYTGSGAWGEITSKGGTATLATAPTTTPSGKGWACVPGAGTFATGNWSGSCGFAENSAGTPVFH